MDLLGLSFYIHKIYTKNKHLKLRKLKFELFPFIFINYLLLMKRSQETIFQ